MPLGPAGTTLFWLCKMHPEIQLDPRDFEELKFKPARISTRGYITIRVEKKTEHLHKFIMGNPNCAVDHINQDKLDNRKENLRLATTTENLRNTKPKSNNTSGYKGVSFCKSTGLWRAGIQVNKESKNLGDYKTAEEAAKKYDFYAKLYFGEFAYLNFPEGG